MVSLAGGKVLITGGAGLIGSHIADKLVEDVSKVVVLDNFVRGSLDNLRWAMQHDNIELVEGDIRDRDLLKEVFQKVDLVFHQAAIRITQCVKQPREALEVLVDGTFNVLEAAVETGVKKVVLASSASIYGTADTFPTEETHHPYNSHTMYAAGKVAGELMARAFYDMYGLDYVSLRYFNVYGPRMDVFGVYTEVMIRWLDCIDTGMPPVIFGDGSRTLDFTYVEDVANANILAAKSDITNETFNVAGGVEVSLTELAELLISLNGADLVPVYRSGRGSNVVQRRHASMKKAKGILHFEAKTSLQEGLQKLMTWRKAAITRRQNP